MKCTTFIFAVACTLLSACATPRPSTPSVAAVVMPANWRTMPALTGQIDTSWWRNFGDPALDTLIEHALTNNPDLGEAAARVIEAQARLHAHHAAQLPSVDLGATGGRSRTIPLTEGINATTFTPLMSMAWEPDFFGRLSHDTDASRAQLLSTRAGRDAVQLSITSTVAESYFTLVGLDAQARTSHATLDERAAALKLAQRLTATGYSSQLELQQAEAEYQATRQLADAADLAVTQQESMLSVLVGDPPEAIVRIASLDTIIIPTVPAGLPSDLLRRRPDLIEAEQTVVAADQTLDAERAEMMPKVALTGSGGIAMATVYANPIGVWALGASVLTPIYDGGRRRATADAAAARRDQAAFAYRKATLVALREVEDALTANGSYAKQRRSLEEQVLALRNAHRIAASRYRSGYAPYLDQIDAQRHLLSAELLLDETRTAQLLTTVALYRAMGGGWSAEDLALD